MKGHIKPVLDEDGYVFVVGPLDGPHSMMWRVWADKNSNVYLTPRPPPGQTLRFKVSLHTPRPYSPLGVNSNKGTKRDTGSQRSRSFRPGSLSEPSACR
jgi:hypothetical protein